MPDPRSAPVTVPTVRATKVRDGHEPLVMVTAYDAPGARIVDAAGVDMILVGDSVANVVLGYEDTLQVTVEDMAHHVAAVARAQPGALDRGRPPVDELPRRRGRHRPQRGHADPGRRPVRQARGGRHPGADGRALVDAEIPVMGHIGLTPQSVHALGGFKVQARDDEAAADCWSQDAKALAAAGAFAVVLEGVPEKVGAAVTDAVDIPTIGIGAGPDLRRAGAGAPRPARSQRRTPKFVRRYADLAEDATAAVASFAADVRSGAFPSDAEVYH